MIKNKIHLWIIILGFNTFLLPSGILAQTVTINSTSIGNFRDSGIWDTAFYPGGPGATTADTYQVNIGNHFISFQPDSFYTGMMPPQTPPALPTTTTSTEVLHVRLMGAITGALQISRDISIEHIEILTATTQLSIINSNTLTVDRLIFAVSNNVFTNGNLVVRYRPSTAYSATINPLFNIQSTGGISFGNLSIDFVDGIELNIDPLAVLTGTPDIRFSGTIPTANNGNVNDWGQELVRSCNSNGVGESQDR